MISTHFFDSMFVMEIARHWRLKRERLAFELGHSCGICGAIFTQDRPVCPECGLHFESGKFVGEIGQKFVAMMCDVLLALSEPD